MDAKLRRALLALLVLALPLFAQEKPLYRVEKHQGGAIRVDGALDEWTSPPTFELKYETRPADNGPAPVRTEAWITYDANNLYVAFRAHDPEPANIRARYSDRDNAFNDDFVGVILDTFNDQRRAFEFFVNPLGVQMDLTQNEMTGNEDSSWDAIWESAGRITATGYDVEMRIPLSSLRFPSTTEMTWGIDAVRVYPRSQSYRLALNRMERGNNCYLCQASHLAGIAGVKPARSMEFDPTLTSSQTGERPNFPDGPMKEGDPKTEVGLTAQWGVTPNFTLSGAVNPDFSQVEADSAQLAVNEQFALFYPEKRPFFLEGGDIFETRFQAIYSRNIADPDWGLKVTGKTGKNAFGAIIASDRRTNFLLPSSQGSDIASLDDKNISTVLRYRRDLFGATTGGFFYTGRESDDYHNRMLGGDILFRWRRTEALRVELMGSQTRYPGQLGLGTDELKGHALRTVYQHIGPLWTYHVLYRDVAKNFRADLGFVPRVDFRERGALVQRTWYPEKSSWTQFGFGLNPTDISDQSGQHLERTVDGYGWMNGPRQSYARLDLIEGDLFYGGETFDRDHVTLYGEMQAYADVFASGQLTIGKQVDFANVQQGDQVRFDPGVRWNVGSHLRMNLDHSYETLDVDGGRLFTANLTQLRATYQFNNRTFVRWIGQHLVVDRDPDLYSFPIDARSRDFNNQLLFSYKINPLTVLFLGYSDVLSGSSQIDLRQQSRTLFLKLGYAWQV